MSSGATHVAGVGVLLLAIGLGVLIGHSGKSTPAPKAAATPEVITVQGGAGGTGTGTAAAATNPSTSPTSAAVHVKGVTKKSQVKEKAAGASTKVQKAATQAAGKVLGNSSNNLPPPTSHTGSKCTNGQAGCQNGKFTGNFFGGG